MCFKRTEQPTHGGMELNEVVRYGLISHPDGITKICDLLERRFSEAPSKGKHWRGLKRSVIMEDASEGRSVASYAANLIVQAKQCSTTVDGILRIYGWGTYIGAQKR
ncbi:hypothetical protein AJ79_10276 [Helicocarpus griseus UAMH5409]|uniref:Uncharacterized protein n=1 Tax=Helicocarpus griseus UAMH5409 TaxID=1447875 RepID=A0A2B7WET0_9EURO|nr:hypothetical protein AJ79_10276 [Helicocarpus griseus UAMH5409]